MNGLTWLGHSTVVIDVDGTRLITDPVLGRRVWHLRRETEVDLRVLETLAGILVSHSHFDHLDHASLRRLDRALPVVVPSGVGGLLWGWGFRNVHEVAAGDELEVGGLAVSVTHAEHASSRWPLTARSASVGYIADGSTSVYFAGDTDLFDGMAGLGPVDVAALPVSGWGSRLPAGHLDAMRAAEALRLLQPRIAVPIHWGTFRTPFGPPLDDRPARELVRAAAEVAPNVDVRILRIGETMALEAVR